MFIVQCYIFIGYRAAESNKEKKNHYMRLLSNLIAQLLLTEIFNS